MARNVNLIGCTNIVVDPDVEDFVAIDCHDVNYDSSYNGKTVIRNGAIIIDGDGIIYEGTINNTITKDVDFSTINPYTIYFIDTTGGDIDILLENIGKQLTFIRSAGGGIITLTPDVGLINGLASFTYTDPIDVFFDGSNWFTK